MRFRVASFGRLQQIGYAVYAPSPLLLDVRTEILFDEDFTRFRDAAEAGMSQKAQEFRASGGQIYLKGN